MNMRGSDAKDSLKISDGVSLTNVKKLWSLVKHIPRFNTQTCVNTLVTWLECILFADLTWYQSSLVTPGKKKHDVFL